MKYAFFGALCAAAGVACASTINLSYVGTAAGFNSKVFLEGAPRDVFSGQIRHVFSGGTGSLAGLSGEYITFCPDLYQTVNAGPNPYDLKAIADLPVAPSVPAMGAAKAAAVNNLFAAFGAAASAGGASSTLAGAFQLAVWEVVYEDPSNAYDITSGDLNATNLDGSPFNAAVLSALSSLFAAAGTPAAGQWAEGYGNLSHQDQLRYIPAPGALALAGAALVAAGRRRR